MLPLASINATLLAAGCGSLLVLGWIVGSAELAVLGGTGFVGLCLAFALTVTRAAWLRRQRVELAWWLSVEHTGLTGSAIAGTMLTLRCSLKNRGRHRFELDDLRPLAPKTVAPEEPTRRFVVPAQSTAELSLHVHAAAAGRLVLQGVVGSVPGPFGLFSSPVYFPSPLSVKVLPRAAARTSRVSRTTAVGSRDHASRASLRRRGGGTELYEIRDYQSGDPFNAIAWKASARAGKPMVREVEREIQHDLALVLDASGSVRAGVPGSRKIDLALELCSRMAHEGLARGDRVSLLVVDGRVIARVPPGEGLTHQLALHEGLLRALENSDEDITDVEDDVLVSRVGQYLRTQEGLDVVHRGRVDASAVLTHVESVLSQESGPFPHAKTKALSRLRRFCQLRGLSLPYRAELPFDGKALGLASALREAAGATQQSRVVVLITDLDAMTRIEPLIDALAMLRARKHAVQVAVPEIGRAEIQRTLGLPCDIWRAMALAEQNRIAGARRRLARVGVELTTHDARERSPQRPSQHAHASGAQR